jgi:hypothetical protein
MVLIMAIKFQAKDPALVKPAAKPKAGESQSSPEFELEASESPKAGKPASKRGAAKSKSAK